MVRTHRQRITIKKGQHGVAERDKVIFSRGLVEVHLVDAGEHWVALKHNHVLTLRNVAFLRGVKAFGKTKIYEAHFRIESVDVTRYHYVAWLQIVICDGRAMNFLHYLKQLYHDI